MRFVAHIFGKRFWREACGEFRILTNRYRFSCNSSQRRLLKELRTLRDLWLHLGSSSTRLPGWVNIDAFPGGDLVLDLRRGLPFLDNSAQFIFHEHFLEHLDYYLEVPEFLAECHRVLKPGGTMRIVVPDVETFVAAYQQRAMDWFQQVEPERNFRSACEGLALTFQYEGQHHSAWDYETLERNLKQGGFNRVERTGYRQGPIRELNLEADSAVRASHSLCVNATK